MPGVSYGAYSVFADFRVYNFVSSLVDLGKLFAAILHAKLRQRNTCYKRTSSLDGL